jgi:hypothetical protein
MAIAGDIDEDDMDNASSIVFFGFPSLDSTNRLPVPDQENTNANNDDNRDIHSDDPVPCDLANIYLRAHNSMMALR